MSDFNPLDRAKINTHWSSFDLSSKKLFTAKVGEILDKVIKTDYWDINAMADAIYSICTNPSLFQYLQEEGKKEVDGITWEKVGLRIRALYEQVLKNYGK